MFVKTEIDAPTAARDVLLQRVPSLAALTDQEAIEELAALLGGVTPAPASGDYIVGSSNATLTAERVATDTATIDVDIATAGQAKWHIIADSVDNTFLANMAAATIKGRASGAGSGDPTDLTAAQTKTILGFPTSSTDNTVPRFDGTSGNLQTSGVTIGDTDIVGGVAAIGVGGATADTTNRISSNSPAVLFNHAGTTSQVKVNKAATGDTASHIFQVGFSGRAEFGLIASDDFQLKTSPDGSAFTTALTALNASGALRVGVNLSPTANDGAALGTTALGWADLHLASGGVINWNAGNVTITQSSGLLTTNANLTITSGGTLTVTGAGNCGLEIGRTDGSTGTPFINFHSGATVVDYDARLIASGGTGSAAGGSLAFHGLSFNPLSNDGSPLGTGTLSWADLCLASGGIINWNNGDVTITHSSDFLVFNAADTGYIFRSDEDAGTTSVIVHNIGDGATTTKLAAYIFFGTDTVATDKEVGRIESVPADTNWISGDLRFYTRAADTVSEAMRLGTDRSIKTPGPLGGIGYATGAGGAVTQATSKSTGVTLNKVCGQITMNNAALNAGTEVSFTVTNSAVAATDTVVVSIASAATVDSYMISVTAVAAGSFRIGLTNVTAAANPAEALVLNFAVIKAVAA